MSERNPQRETRDNLMAIVQKKGWIYTLGWCMGVLIDLSLYDYQLYRRIRMKREQLDELHSS